MSHPPKTANAAPGQSGRTSRARSPRRTTPSGTCSAPSSAQLRLCPQEPNAGPVQVWLLDLPGPLPGGHSTPPRSGRSNGATASGLSQVLTQTPAPELYVSPTCVVGIWRRLCLETGKSWVLRRVIFTGYMAISQDERILLVMTAEAEAEDEALRHMVLTPQLPKRLKSRMSRLLRTMLLRSIMAMSQSERSSMVAAAEANGTLYPDPLCG